MSEPKKTDADILNELSCMPSVTPKQRTSTLANSSSGLSSRFKNESEMNSYIQKCIDDALNRNSDVVKSTTRTSSNEVKDEYHNPRKESATGKHAGVNSFIRNLGTIGYGEERKDMVNNNTFSNVSKHVSEKSDDKIADNILQKLKSREQKERERKLNPPSEEVEKKKPQKYKSSKKKSKNNHTDDDEPEMLTQEKKTYSFTRVNSIFNKDQSMSEQIRQQMGSNKVPGAQQQQQMKQLQHQMVQNQQLNNQPHMLNNTQQYGNRRVSSLHNQQHNMMNQPNLQGMNLMRQYQQGNGMMMQHQQNKMSNSGRLNNMAPQANQQQQRQQREQHQQRQQQQNNQNLTQEYQHSFVFIIPSYNGAKWIKRIFDSIKNQSYQNYRIIYVNDCSDDNTIQELSAYSRINPRMNIMVINNQQRQWPAYSRYIACRQTYDHEICIFLDGDDWLVDNECLTTLNTVFQNPNIYATFGSMENAPWQFKKWKKYNRANINDGEGAYFPHLRTTRANIVKAIPPYYMQTETHEWLHVCTDVALFMAVIEAVGSDGYVFLKNAFVHYNTSNHNKNTTEGYTNSKGSDMRIYYRSTIRDKVPMKKIISPIVTTPQLNQVSNQSNRGHSISRRYR